MMISAVQQPVIDQLSNTSKAPFSGAKMPEENAVVLVKVLEKLNGTYKLLVDGSVFQSSLPFGASLDEEFLAKVISKNPFTLQADGLLTQKQSALGGLTVLLQKLGIKETKEARLVMEILLRTKKPLLKVKFEKLLESLDGNTKLDDIQVALLAGLYFAGSAEVKSFNAEAKHLFKDSIDSIISKLFELITTALKTPSFTFLNPALETAFFSQERNNGNSTRKLVDLVFFLDSQCKTMTTSATYAEVKQAKEISVLLTEYLVQKSVYNRFDVYPDFIISCIYNEYVLSVFNHARETPEGRIALSCDLGKDIENSFIQLRGSLEKKAARLVCFSKKLMYASSVIARLTEMLKAGGYEISILLKEYKAAEYSAPMFSSVNCKV